MKAGWLTLGAYLPPIGRFGLKFDASVAVVNYDYFFDLGRYPVGLVWYPGDD